MKFNIIKCGGALALSAILFAGCAEQDWLQPEQTDVSSKTIDIACDITQVNLTRVNDSGFCDGDVMGVYIVDYVNSAPGTLANSGNRATNLRYTFDENAYKWNAEQDVYWRDKTTHIDVYAYYPYTAVTDVNAYSFEVQRNQNADAANGQLGGYEASDFLWGKCADVAPTDQIVRVALGHRMSSVKVKLEMGSGFDATDWAKLDPTVLVKNVKTKATIDLATGEVKATGDASTLGITPYKKSDAYRAIVVPQTIAAGTTLFSITLDGMPYVFTKNEAFSYEASKMHTFTIKVDKKEQAGAYTFTLIGESITAWENDDVSHDATMKEYVIVKSEAGKLEEAIAASGKDYSKIKNLKVTGEINYTDFMFMRDKMSVLSAVNLKDVRIKADPSWGYEDDVIPSSAFYNKKSLTNFVFPDKLVKIGYSAFSNCNLTGSLYIPEGVTEIGSSAFSGCKSLTGTLSLPSTLKKIGDWAFQDCGFISELNIPNSVTEIGGNAFNGCSGFYGELHLPDGLTTLGAYAFSRLANITGSLSIPKGITNIPGRCFSYCGFNGTLTLHDGITAIGERAFSGSKFRGELVLPSELTVIEDQAFYNCRFSGTLKLPETLISIGKSAFCSNSFISGILECPKDLLVIGSSAFYGCYDLEGIVFNENLETIGANAFYGCYYIGSIVSNATVLPKVMSGAFDGVAKDNFALEVPESAIAAYQTASGWSDFRRITAHRELSTNTREFSALNGKCTREFVLRSEGEWIVKSKPDWITMPTSGNLRKDELTLTFDAMPHGNGDRTGEIIFELKDKSYTYKCTVSQYDYEDEEDQVIELQKATRGRGINLVFLGDGYAAKDIADGSYLKMMQEQVNNFFAIEPYNTYRDYFNVYVPIVLSPESGIGTANTIINTRFNTYYSGGFTCEDNTLFNYVIDKVPAVTEANIDQSLIVFVPNIREYYGVTKMYSTGAAIAFCPPNDYDYPYDTRGIVQHEAGGHGFGKLGDEYIYHNAFISTCGCICCGHVTAFNSAKALGWYENMSLSGKMHEVPWSHLIFDSRYSDIVDIYEGGYMHSRGVYRSEQTSCMNNNIPYFSTISREAIVKRIKAYAGEVYSFEDFVKNDSHEVISTSRSALNLNVSSRGSVHQHSPIIHQGSPLKNRKRK